MLATIYKSFEGEEIDKEKIPQLSENSEGKRSIDSFENSVIVLKIVLP